MTNEKYKLAPKFTIFCHIHRLVSERRLNFTAFYHMAVSSRVVQLNEQLRYWANASAFSNNSVKSWPDGSTTFELSINMEPVPVAPVYYLTIWAHDSHENYATRSDIQALTIPSFFNGGQKPT